MENQALTTSLNYLHKAAHTEDGWIHPLKDAVADVTLEQALYKPAADVASIWEVTAHTTPYLYDVLRVLRGEERVQHEDWHTVSDTSERAWLSLRSDLLAGIEQLGEEIAKLKEGDFLVAPPNRKTPRWELLTDIAVHDAYHAGQIIKLKQLYAAANADAREVASV